MDGWSPKYCLGTVGNWICVNSGNCVYRNFKIPHTPLGLKKPSWGKGQLISKENCRALISPKKQTLDFYF